MPNKSFAHLHVHSEYSILDGAAQITPLIAEVARLGQPAVALTDHGSMFGAFAFWQAAKAANVKPIIGIEAYLAPADRFHRKPVFWGTPAQRADDVAGGGAYTHMTMLAENADGLRNLFRLSSLASLEGYFYKPRMDRDLLAEHAAGIVATTGCPSGEVQTRLRLGQDTAALQAAADFRDIFGADNFYLELMDHGLHIERRVRDGLLAIGRNLNLTPVSTNDAHYVTRDQAPAHDALLCVQSGSTLSSADRFKFDGDGYYLKSAAEMRAVFSGDLEAACDATLLITDRIQDYSEVFKHRDLMARGDVPDGHVEASWLRHLAVSALRDRRLDDDARYADRLDYELGIIEHKGYPGYFLVVADICREMRERKVRYNTRGSAAGSLVAYVLGVTNVDPIPLRILFERFLNPDRPSAPDIDLDIDESRRAEMIQYVTDKYGADYVAQIATFGIVKSRAAVKDAARVLGYPYALGDRIAKALPPVTMGKDVPLAQVMTTSDRPESAALRQMCSDDPTVKSVVDLALGLEGSRRSIGVHAAGVVLSSEPLIDVLPIWKRPDGSIATGFDMNEVDALGLVKMDFLGLRNLTVLDNAVRSVEANRGVTLDLTNLPLTDAATYQSLAAGDTLGVFQLDSPGISGLLRLMKPTCFEDISATLALYRPGPMGVGAHTGYAHRKNGVQQVTPIHPELADPLADILDETYGLIVYQEQVMSIVQKVAGYTLGRADILRKAMGKKKKDVLDREFVPFRDGMRGNGYSDDAIQALWDTLLPFSDYAFNKAHTASYAMMSYWTGYLKTNYPVEYMAALLTSVGDDKDKMAVYLAECRRMGIRVLPPDVNQSADQFTPVGGEILFGLGAVRNVGTNVVAAIVRAREASGRFTSFADFLRKVDTAVCNKRTVESLIKAGAFDSLGHARRGLLGIHEAAVDVAAAVKREEANGQFDLFGEVTEASAPVAGPTMEPSSQEWDSRTLLTFEREMLGLYVSSHPLANAERVLSANGQHTAAQLAAETDMPDGAPVTLAGMLGGVSRRVSKAGRAWASATLEDLSGSVEVVFFGATYEVCAPALVDDAVVTVRGKLNRRDAGSASVVVFDMAVIDVSASEGAPLTITWKAAAVTPDRVEALKDILGRHPGRVEVHIRLGVHTVRLPSFLVEVTPALLGDLKALVGAGNVS